MADTADTDGASGGCGTTSPPSEVAAFVLAAAEGDQHAWNALVDRYTGLVWSIARGHRLGGADAADVVQTTWLRLVENLGRIRNPAAVGSWLATTARRESLRVIDRSARTMPTDSDWLLELPPHDGSPGVDDRLLRTERDAVLLDALRELPPRCQTLLRVLMADPPPRYEDVSAALDMPIGSIGPTRGRCLERLRTIIERMGITDDTDRSHSEDR